MRGELTAGEYAKEISLAREQIAAIDAPHWQRIHRRVGRERDGSTRAIAGVQMRVTP